MKSHSYGSFTKRFTFQGVITDMATRTLAPMMFFWRLKSLNDNENNSDYDHDPSSQNHQERQPNGVCWRFCDHFDKLKVMTTISSGLEVEWCSLKKELQLSPIWNFPPHSTPSWRHTINRCRFYILMFCYIEIQKRSEQYNSFVPFFTSSASFKYFNANFRHFTLILNVFMLIVDVF